MFPAYRFNARTSLPSSFQGGEFEQASIIFSLFQEHLGGIILKAMSEKSRRDLILGFVNEDPVLKEKIIQGEKLDVKRNAELSEDDGFGSDRVDSSEEKLVLSDSSFEGQEDDKEVNKRILKEHPTTSDQKEMKEEKEERRQIPEDNLASCGNPDPDLNSRPIDSNPGGNEAQENPQDSYSSETKVSEKKEQASDTEIYDEDDEDEWEYEWEEGEDNEYEYMEHSEDEDDYTVESFAGSFSISVSK